MLAALPLDLQIHILLWTDLCTVLNYVALNQETYHALMPQNHDEHDQQQGTTPTAAYTDYQVYRWHCDSLLRRLWLPMIRLAVCDRKKSEFLLCFDQCINSQHERSSSSSSSFSGALHQHNGHTMMMSGVWCGYRSLKQLFDMLLLDRCGDGSSSVTNNNNTSDNNNYDHSCKRSAIHGTLIHFSNQYSRMVIDQILRFRGMLNIGNHAMFVMVPGYVYEWDIEIHACSGTTNTRSRDVALVGVETDHFNFGDTTMRNKIGGYGQFGVVFDLNEYCCVTSGKSLRPPLPLVHDRTFDMDLVACHGTHEWNEGDVITIRFDMRHSSIENDGLIAEVLGVRDGRVTHTVDDTLLRSHDDSRIRQFNLIEGLGASFHVFVNREHVCTVPCVMGQRFHAAVGTNGLGTLRDFSLRPASASTGLVAVTRDVASKHNNFHHFVSTYCQTLQSDVLTKLTELTGLPYSRDAILHALVAHDGCPVNAALALLENYIKSKFV